MMGLMLTALPDPPNAEARRAVARRLNVGVAARAFFTTLAGGLSALELLADGTGNGLAALTFLVSAALALTLSVSSSRAIGRLRAEGAALASGPPERHQTVTLPERLTDGATIRAAGPEEGGSVTVRTAAGSTVCELRRPGQVAFCRYDAGEDAWSVIAVDWETGERLATEDERAGFRDGRECRTWGLYARVR
jgi:hypothetical protein